MSMERIRAAGRRRSNFSEAKAIGCNDLHNVIAVIRNIAAVTP